MTDTDDTVVTDDPKFQGCDSHKNLECPEVSYRFSDSLGKALNNMPLLDDLRPQDVCDVEEPVLAKITNLSKLKVLELRA